MVTIEFFLFPISVKNLYYIYAMNEISHSLSYATPQDPWSARMVIQGAEVLLGRKKIERVYGSVLNKKLPTHTLMGAALEELRIPLKMDGFPLENLPSSGPLIFIANHPFGVVDGLAMGEIVSRVRKEFGILVNSVLCRNPRLDPFFLPIDFREIPEALRTNLNSRKEALRRLENGEAIAIFPSGAVATAPFPGKKPEELEWKRFVVKLITQSNAQVVPLYFHGENSIWFQVASYFHQHLRLGLLLHEVRNKIGKPMRVTVGEPIAPEDWKSKDPIRELLPFLREKTLSLSNS
jgi:putative hemolysin